MEQDAVDISEEGTGGFAMDNNRWVEEVLKDGDRVSVFGTVSPFSHLETACLVTNSFLAISSCDRLCFFLKLSRTSFVSILFTSLVQLILY